MTYTYDGAHRVTSRTDAKGQRTEYSYDTYGRLTEVRHLVLSYGTLEEDQSQRWHYYYDTNPLDSAFSLNALGRMTAVEFGVGNLARISVPMAYLYSYNPAGRVIRQQMKTTMTDPRTQTPQDPVSMTAQYGWDNEGRMSSLTYPDGGSLAYSYDAMGQLGSLSYDPENLIATATYGVAGELTELTRYLPNSQISHEQRTYNSLLQVTRIRTTDYPEVLMDVQYNYSATQNNGRITQSIDGVTGESVTYQYDALNRLVHAETADSLWGESYGFDRFGNLQSKTPTKGSAPAFSATYDPATNRQIGVSYDANGNPAGYNWNVENRLVSQTAPDATAVQWGYDPWGKRVVRAATVDGAADWEYTFYGVTGQRLAMMSCQYGDAPDYTLTCGMTGRNEYFGGRLLKARYYDVYTDRLGSVRQETYGASRAYYPYGEERTTSADGTEKFGTYLRDWVGQDYADQRYYSATSGRFLTPDPSLLNVDLGNPGSWNAYGYTNGDPVNFNDPTGLGGPETGIVFNNICSLLPMLPMCQIPGAGPGGKGAGQYLEQSTPMDGEGSGGADPAPSNWQLMPAALARAIQALSLSVNCMNLFGNSETRQGGFNPVNVLTAIAFQGEYASIQFLEKPAKWGTAEVSGPADKLLITINTYSDGVHGYWNLGNIDMNAETLLHELGHVYDSLTGSGGSVIKTPDVIPLIGAGRSRWNDWRIDQDCFDGTLGYKTP